jgi:hypothetical protein
MDRINRVRSRKSDERAILPSALPLVVPQFSLRTGSKNFFALCSGGELHMHRARARIKSISMMDCISEQRVAKKYEILSFSLLASLKGQTIGIPDLRKVFRGWPVGINQHYERMVPLVDQKLETRVLAPAQEEVTESV